MKITIKVGEVSIITDGLDLDRKQVRGLLMDCAGIAATLQPEAETSTPLGFTAHLERLPDELAADTYEDEE